MNTPLISAVPDGGRQKGCEGVGAVRQTAMILVRLVCLVQNQNLTRV